MIKQAKGDFKQIVLVPKSANVIILKENVELKLSKQTFVNWIIKNQLVQDEEIKSDKYSFKQIKFYPPEKQSSNAMNGLFYEGIGVLVDHENQEHQFILDPKKSKW